ncbi:MAG: thymidine phosphorylase [Sumerlaeia bacterium]
MNVPELIRIKREGGSLTPQQIEDLIGGYVRNEVEEYQISAFLMAVFFRGMAPEEAAALTRVMRNSGTVYDLSDIEGPKVDKHSTGGVGDKVSLVLAPLVASAGLVDPMVSGRGLGHTGGTLDKLDSIPGYRWNLGQDEFKAVLRKVGCAIVGQTADFVPADKRLYALRDVTATVESIPLISGSILSKKSASGAEGLVMDVKCGSGAFMPTLDQARALAESLVAIGTALGLNMATLITQMSQPLGRMVGNSLEVLETIEILKGAGPGDSREVTLRLGAEMVVLGGLAPDPEAAYKLLAGKLDSGAALEKFIAWTEAQGGDPSIVDDPSLLPLASGRELLTAPRDGVVSAMNTRQIGVAANTLGAGRIKTTDEVDPGVGLEIHAHVGDRVAQGDPLVTIVHRDGRGLEACRTMLAEAIVLGEEPADPLPLILDRIGLSA